MDQKNPVKDGQFTLLRFLSMILVLAACLAFFWHYGFLSDYMAKAKVHLPSDYSAESDPVIPLMFVLGAFCSAMFMFLVARMLANWPRFPKWLMVIGLFVLLVNFGQKASTAGRYSSICTWERCDEYFVKVPMTPFLGLNDVKLRICFTKPEPNRQLDSII